MNISTFVETTKQGNFRLRKKRVSSPKRKSFPLALGIRVNTRVTVTTREALFTQFHTAKFFGA